MSLKIIIRAFSMRARKFGSIAVLFTLVWSNTAQAASVGEPVFDSPVYGEKQLSAELAFSGRADIRSEVGIRIDGEPAGRVQFSATSTSYASFIFTPVEPLAPGYHYVEALAFDPAGEQYARQSLWWLFHVKDSSPAPVLLKTVELAGNRLMIAGVVKSGHSVRVYLDGQSVIASTLIEHPSGTGSFSLVLPAAAAGYHEIELSAVRADGKEGVRSEPYPVSLTGIVMPASPSPVPHKAVARAPSTPIPGNVPTPQPGTPQSPAPVIITEQAALPEPVLVVSESTGTPSVVVVPAQRIDTATSAPPQAEQKEPASTDRGQRSALIVLGLLLAALIIWYATRRDGGSTEGGAPEGDTASDTLPPPASGAQDGSRDSVGSPDHLRLNQSEGDEMPWDDTSGGAEDEIPPPPPPPPSPNFTQRMQY